MEVERRERDPDTGEMTPLEAEVGAFGFDSLGAGFSDVFGKIAAKLTGKTAKKLATKAAEKGAAKIGEKTGQFVGEKIFEKFSAKPISPKAETKGKEIGEMLKSISSPPENSKFQKINNVYADLL